MAVRRAAKRRPGGVWVTGTPVLVGRGDKEGAERAAYSTLCYDIDARLWWSSAGEKD